MADASALIPAADDDGTGSQLERALRHIERLETILQARSLEASQAGARLRSATDFLREVYRAMPAGVVILDGDGAVEDANDAMCALLGLPHEALVGRPFAALFAPDDAPDLAAILAQPRGAAVSRTERGLQGPDGAVVPVLFSASALPRAVTRRGRAVVGIALDLRERKRLEDELRQAQRLESVGRLAAGVAHEINTPIQFVGDSLQFVGEAMTDLGAVFEAHRALRVAAAAGAPTAELAARAAEAEADADLGYLIEHLPIALRRALDGLQRVAEIVRSLKAFSHPDASEMSTVDLNHAIRCTLAIASAEYKYVASLETDLGDLPPVRCHGGEINQVILNLVINAAHAIGDVVAGTDARGTIAIRTRCDGDDWVEIAVSDTGAGIPEAVRGRIFDPFFTTKTVGRGSGQGLAIARTVIHDKHGGTLRFDTELGKGTTFTVRLPVHGAAR